MDSSSKVMVAESGNKRKDVSKEDLTQAIRDIKNWFSTNHPDFFASLSKDSLVADEDKCS